MFTGMVILQQFLLIEASTRILFSSEHQLPFMYPRTPCSLSHALIYHFHMNLGKCEQACQAVTRCGNINYNPATKMCVLQEDPDSAVKGTETAPANCISLRVPSSNEDSNRRTDDLCLEHTCNDTSMCVPLPESSSYKCVQRFCPPPPVLAHASMLVTTARWTGSKSAYSCEVGFTRSGPPGITCNHAGEWSPVDVICHPNCPDIPVIDNAVMVSWFPYRLFANTTVQYVCAPGYYNLSRTTVVCDEDGRWSDFECFPYCYQSQLPTLVKGFAINGDKYTVNMTARYTCKQGYYLSPGSPLLFCDVTGAWSDLEVTCYKHCLEPADPAGGFISVRI